MFVRRDRNTRSSDIAFMGMMLAINQILLYFAGITSFNETIFMGLASAIIGIVIIEKGEKNGIVFYISSAMMAAVIMPNKLNAIGYIFLLGLYTVVKYYIEKSGDLKKELITKAVYFVIISLAAAIAGNRIIYQGSPILMVPMIIAVMAVYDYAATVMLTTYRNRFGKNMKR